MFAKKEDIKSLGRLKKRSDFLCVQKHEDSKKWVSKSMIVEMCPNEERNEAKGLRFGLTVSKRVSKKAVDRNRTKRRLRAVAFEVLPDFKAHKIDVVLIGRVSTEDQSYDVLKKDLVWCLKRLGYETNETLTN